ncbi:hypothetical protein KUV89_07455 [Marinobacter hydrocarbonoclasticus]|nr:hypothetical protein [Marinobacter nauticus]
MTFRSMVLALASVAAVFCGVLFAGTFQGQQDTPIVYRPPALKLAENQQMNVYYFHGDVRCTTCKLIEKYTVEGVQQGFIIPIGQGRLQQMSINVDRPENAHFIADFELITRSVVVELTEDDMPVAWRRLDRVWELVADEQAFVDYLYAEMDRLNPGRRYD